MSSFVSSLNRFPFKFLLHRDPPTDAQSTHSTSSSYSSTADGLQVKLNLHLPSYGKLFFPFPNVPSQSDTDQAALVGEIEVRLPPGIGPMKCKGMRIVWRSWCAMDMNNGKGRQSVSYDDKIMLEDLQKVLIEEGSWRCAFLRPLGSFRPAPTDATCADFRVTHHLFAEIIGLRPPTEKPVHTYWRGASEPDFLHNDVPEESVAPLPPSYDDAEDAEWLPESVVAQRNFVGVYYNPSPTGGPVTLDDVATTHIGGLGLVQMRCGAKVFTVAGPCLVRVSIPSPSPAAVIYGVRVSVRQQTTFTWPEDGSQQKFTTLNPFAEFGKLPPLGLQLPRKDTKAVWKGRDAGGYDGGGWDAEVKTRFPDQYTSRWTTPPGVSSPISLKHWLVYQILFSIYGEEADGSPMCNPGPGAVRLMVRAKETVFPSCEILPQNIEVPIYNPNSVGDSRTLPTLADRKGSSSPAPIIITKQNTIMDAELSALLIKTRQTAISNDCELCGEAPEDILCTACPSAMIPHTRHGKYSTCEACAVWTCACTMYEKYNGEYGEGEDWGDFLGPGFGTDPRMTTNEIVGQDFRLGSADYETSADRQLAEKIQTELEGYKE